MDKGEIYDLDAFLFCTVVRHLDQDGNARFVVYKPYNAFYRRHNTRENSIEMREVLVNLNKRLPMTRA